MTKIYMKRFPLITSIGQIRNFLKTNQLSGLKLEIITTKHKYEFISETLWRVGYHRLSRGDKHVVLKYLNFFTGYSVSHLKRLAFKWRNGTLAYNPSRKRHKFSKKYFPNDIARLIETDIAQSCLSAEATREIMEREYKVFKRAEYATIAQISPAHIYNIRNNNRQYNSSAAKFFHKTKRAAVDIGLRRKPQPGGQPGYVRVDTVHQGDYLGNKGVYHINIVDEVTQYELIATVEQISEKYLKPVVKELLKLFPFMIHEFHADNGSEYINRFIAELLNKIHVELTKSRSRHSNDNALVESKNGSVIRKIFGRNYIHRKWAKQIYEFDRKYLNVYLNYHRPCAFAEMKPDKNGKLRKKYTHWSTPYEKFKSLPDAEEYLKPDFSFTELDKTAYALSDNQFAETMNKAKRELFKKIAKDNIYQNQKIGQNNNENPLEWVTLKRKINN